MRCIPRLCTATTAPFPVVIRRASPKLVPGQEGALKPPFLLLERHGRDQRTRRTKANAPTTSPERRRGPTPPSGRVPDPDKKPRCIELQQHRGEGRLPEGKEVGVVHAHSGERLHKH